MRKALIGIFLATAIAVPAAAQDSGEEVWVSERYKRLGERNAARAERRMERQEQRAVRQGHHGGGQVGHHSGGAVADIPRHGEVHREYRREHRELHRSNPSRREHREFHREVQQDHNQVHRQTHRGVHQDIRQEHEQLHRNNPTRREHRQFHREVTREHDRYHGQWDRGWRNDRRYDWQGYRYQNRGLYSPGYYYSPYRDRGYSRFGIGLRLNSGFYSSRYWINDPWRYRLPEAYAGTRWVRYYNDVLLVDVFTGEVVDVIYNFFW